MPDKYFISMAVCIAIIVVSLPWFVAWDIPRYVWLRVILAPFFTLAVVLWFIGMWKMRP